MAALYAGKRQTDCTLYRVRDRHKKDYTGHNVKHRHRLNNNVAV